MPAPAQPWTADEVLRAVEDALRPLVTGLGGGLDVASDPDHALELLKTAPSKWRLILGWPGFGDHPSAREGMGSHRIYLVIQVAKGLSVKPGDLLHRGRASLPGGPMGALIDVTGRWVRALHFPDGSGVDHAGFAQQGSAWLEIDGISTKQHQLDFSAACALTAHDTRIPLSITPL
jgi:hypothetical protein